MTASLGLHAGESEVHRLSVLRRLFSNRVRRRTSLLSDSLQSVEWLGGVFNFDQCSVPVKANNVPKIFSKVYCFEFGSMNCILCPGYPSIL